MGRIRTKLIKRLTREIIETHRDALKKDFTENKKILTQLTEMQSKKLRNVLAGSITKTIKHNG
jgi:small subunit ribosomal protein S17e